MGNVLRDKLVQVLNTSYSSGSSPPINTYADLIVARYVEQAKEGDVEVLLDLFNRLDTPEMVEFKAVSREPTIAASYEVLVDKLHAANCENQRLHEKCEKLDTALRARQNYGRDYDKLAKYKDDLKVKIKDSPE